MERRAKVCGLVGNRVELQDVDTNQTFMVWEDELPVLPAYGDIVTYELRRRITGLQRGEP